MKMEDYEMIQKIIYSDLAEGNLDDLVKLRNFLNIQFFMTRNNMQNERKGVSLTDDILSLKLLNFLDMNIKNDHGFRKNALACAIGNIKGIRYENLLVADTFGIGKDEILKSGRQLGKYTVEKYDQLLKCFGYSLDQPLPIIEHSQNPRK